jgi:tyrosine-protein phosphatase SIW14
LQLRSLATFLAGTVLGGTLVYGVLSYKHSTGPFQGDRGQIEGRSPAWARPWASQHLHNFHQVSDQLYRGAQPDRNGFLELQKLGIKAVVNLRLTSTDHKLLEGTSLVPVDIPAEPWDLEEADVLSFLRVVSDPLRVPVFVHCSHGADRTGAMSAIYRVVVQGWDKEEAIREMTQGGFGYHTLWDNLPTTIRKLDVQGLKAKLDLPSKVRPTGDSAGP